MAEFNVVGFDEVEKLFLREEETATKAVPKMLEAGAEVLVKAQQAEATAMNIKDSGDFIKSIKATKIKIDGASSAITVAPTGKDSKGVRNAEKGFIAEYGKTGQPARTWMETANIKSEDEVHQAMAKVWEGMKNGD